MSDDMHRRFTVATDHPAFDGHFPGQPILPGVALLAEVMEAAMGDPELARAVGAEPRIAVVKFLGAVRPGAVLEIRFRLGARALDWQADEGTRRVASGQFTRADTGPAAP